jgi:hypothetical protein
MAGFEKSAQEMLHMIEAEIAHAEDRVRKLKERRSVVLSWVAEEHPQASFPGVANPLDSASPVVLAMAAKEIMSDGVARSNADIATALREKGLIPRHGKYDKRKINTIMLALMNRGVLVRKNDKWHTK